MGAALLQRWNRHGCRGKDIPRTSIDESLGAKIQALPFVAQATPMIFNMMDLTPEINALVFGWKADSYDFDSLAFISGGRFHDRKPEVMLGDVLAENLGKKVGDSLDFKAQASR